MKSSQGLGLLAAIYLAPHVDRRVAILLGSIFLIASVVMEFAQ